VLESVNYYAELCQNALLTEDLDLLVLPECALQGRVSGNPLDLAVPLDGVELARFRRIARENGVRIVAGLWERDADAVHNTAVLIDPTGEIEGVYRKVHLAVASEHESGVLPGSGFPVFDTDIGRIGCTICVDNSTLEAARLVALGGAEILVMPIAGDNRADRWSLGPSIFNESRWRAIMRTRALDNQVVVVAARNDGVGSCIIDCAGDVLAWNEGDRDSISTVVDLDAPARCWNGATFRDMQWMQRRPHLYGALLDSARSGAWAGTIEEAHDGIPDQGA
jgi:predicted amidohydrolase